jgi:hypothetical protein
MVLPIRMTARRYVTGDVLSWKQRLFGHVTEGNVMAVAGAVSVAPLVWEWREITSSKQLGWLPCDYWLLDADGVECVSVGVGAAPPSGWIRCATGEQYAPILPARTV